MESNLSNKGRKPGAKNKLPNNDLVCELINTIITDLNDNYSKLTTNQKIKILNVVKHKLIIEDTRGAEFQPVIITGMQVL
jgi:hypothetical protein